MNKIVQLHLDAIEESKDYCVVGVWKVIDDVAASKSAEITEQIAIEFAEWLIKELVLSSHGKFLSYTPKELFQEFLKTKQ